MDIWDGKCIRSGDTCCVCGSTQKLTRHHVVPGCYREPLHHDRNYHDFYDILVVCDDCHDRYEMMHAQGLKRRLCKKYEVPMEGVGVVWPAGSRAMRAAGALVRHGDRIPAERTAELMADIVSHLGREPDESDMSCLAEMKWQPRPGADYTSHGEFLVAEIDDIPAFWRMWRIHFVEKMKPRFLPANWNPDREVRWSPDRCRQRRGSNCPCIPHSVAVLIARPRLGELDRIASSA